MDRLKTTQNKALRIITFSSPLTNVDNLFEQFKILNIFQLVRFKTGILIKNILDGLLIIPSVIPNVLPHNFSTRGRDSINLVNYSVRNNYGKFHILHLAHHVWNAIPIEIKTEKSISVFKRELKELLLRDFKDRNIYRFFINIV